MSTLRCVLVAIVVIGSACATEEPRTAEVQQAEWSGWCGDSNCDSDIGEDCGWCPQDCGSCGWCGDGWCDGSAGEDCNWCSGDCGDCAPPCTPSCPAGSCDWQGDGCGGSIWCGDCAPPCTPSCPAGSCDWQGDGCGGSIWCGDCAPPPPPPPLPGYVGCYTDDPNRGLPNLLGVNQTVTGCISLAYDYRYDYAGLQNGGECWAGNEARWQLVDDSECNMVCNAYAGQTCGGVWRNSVYDTGYEPPEPPPQQCCTSYAYMPGRYTNVTPGDVVVHSTVGFVSPIVQMLGESDTHALMIQNFTGDRISHSRADPDTIDSHCYGNPLDEDDLKYVKPGVENNVYADYIGYLQPGVVIDGAGYACTGSARYQPYSYSTNVPNGQCIHFLRDSCGVAAYPTTYNPTQVYAASDAMYNTVYDECRGRFGFWGTLGSWIFGCGTVDGTCRDAANQVVNEFRFGLGSSHSDLRNYWAGWITDVVSPTQLLRSNPNPQYPAAIAGGYYECVQWSECYP